jgi:hypothetical protein
MKHHAMKKHCGVVRLLAFLTLALSKGEWSASRSGRFTDGKNFLYPLDRRVGGTQSRSGRSGEENNLCPFRESNQNVA